MWLNVPEQDTVNWLLYFKVNSFLIKNGKNLEYLRGKLLLSFWISNLLLVISIQKSMKYPKIKICKSN